MAQTIEMTHLAEDQIGTAAGTLARAFHGDPLQSYVFPDPGERERLSPAHFAPILRYGLLYGEVLTTASSVRGAAVWLPPGAGEMTPERLSASGLAELSTAIGEGPSGRFEQALAGVAPLHERDAPEPHWYLLVIGVDPAAQGAGVGRALISPILQRADAAGVPAYLETAQPSNIPFYQRLGFRVMADIMDATTGLRMWTFRRDPA